MDNLLTLLGVAGARFIMGIPCGFRTTSFASITRPPLFHDALYAPAACWVCQAAAGIRNVVARNGKFSRTAQAHVLYYQVATPSAASLPACHGGKPGMTSTAPWRRPGTARRQNQSNTALLHNPWRAACGNYRMRVSPGPHRHSLPTKRAVSAFQARPRSRRKMQFICRLDIPGLCKQLPGILASPDEPFSSVGQAADRPDLQRPIWSAAGCWPRG